MEGADTGRQITPARPTAAKAAPSCPVPTRPVIVLSEELSRSCPALPPALALTTAFRERATPDLTSIDPVENLAYQTAWNLGRRAKIPGLLHRETNSRNR